MQPYSEIASLGIISLDLIRAKAGEQELYFFFPSRSLENTTLRERILCINVCLIQSVQNGCIGTDCMLSLFGILQSQIRSPTRIRIPAGAYSKRMEHGCEAQRQEQTDPTPSMVDPL